MTSEVEFSIVVPVYGNAGSLPELVSQFDALVDEIGPLEAIFVVDGSPDDSYDVLARLLPMQRFSSQLISHSRNFGALAATRTGFEFVRSELSAVIAADLQEPPHLLLDFYRALSPLNIDVVVGTRISRNDPWATKLASRAFWAAYRRLVQRDIPPGGVDVFGCNSAFRRELVALSESNTSLIGLIYWLGFRRAEVEYVRAERVHGRSGWSFSKKMRYLSDSVFAFTDLPVRLLMLIGAFGVVTSLLVSIVVASARMFDVITVPGYAATMLVISFFAALNLFAVGLVGSYVWRAFENTKQRPRAVVMRTETFEAVQRTSNAQ